MEKNHQNTKDYEKREQSLETKPDVPDEILHDFKQLASPIADLIGPDGMDTVLETLYKISRGNLPFFLRLIEHLTELIQQLFDRGQKQMVMDVFNIAGDLADIHPSPAAAMLNRSFDIIGCMDTEGLEMISEVAGNIAFSSGESAGRFIEKSPYLMAAVLEKSSKQVLRHIYHLAKATAAFKWDVPMDLFENAPDIIDKLNACGDKNLPNEIYTLANRTARKYPRAAVGFVEKSPDIIERVGYQRFRKIADAILFVAAVNEASAVKILTESSMVIDHLLKKINPDAVVSVFELVAQTADASDAVARALWVKGPDWIDTAGLEILKKAATLSCKIGGSSLRAATAFMETGPELHKRIGIEGLEKTAALFSELGSVCDRTAEQLCRTSPEIMDSAAYEDFEQVARFCSILSKGGPGLTKGVIQAHPAWINRLLTHTDRQHIHNIYRLLNTMAEENPRIAVALMEHMPDLFARTTVEQLEEIAFLALKTAEQGWTPAAGFIKIAPTVIDLMGYEALLQIAGLIRILAAKNVYSAVILLEKIPSIAKRLVQSTDSTTASLIMDGISEIASLDTDAFAGLFEKSPVLARQIGLTGIRRIVELGRELASVHPDIAAQFIKSSFDIIELLDLSSLIVISGYYQKITESNPDKTIRLIRETPGIIHRLLGSVDRQGILNIYALVDRIADDNREISAALFEKSPDYVEAAGIEGFDMISRQAMIYSGMDSAKAVRFAEGASMEFSDFMENLPQGLRLKNIKAVLSNYLMALMGRRIDIEEGGKADTDGCKIILPERIREFQEDDLNFIFYKVMATHQEAHLEFGTFEFEITEVQDLVERLKTAYRKEDTMEGGDLERFYGLFSEPALIRDIVHLAEDFRVESLLKAEYPVLGEQILFVHQHNLRKKPAIEKMKNNKQKMMEIIHRELLAEKPQAVLSDEEQRVLSTVRGETDFPTATESCVRDSVKAAANIYFAMDEVFHDSYKPMEKATEPLNQNKVLKNIGSFGKTSKQIFEQLHGPQGEKRPREEDHSTEKTEPSSGAGPSQTIPDTDKPLDQGAQKTRSPRSAESEEAEGHLGHGGGEEKYEERETPSRSMKFSSTDRIEKLLRDLFKKRGITPAEVAKKMMHMKPDQAELFLNRMESTIPMEEELEKERGTRLYPEWGSDINGYRENWARIRQQKLTGTSKEFYTQTLQEHTGLLRKVRREFQMMRPEASARINRQYDGEEVDLDAAVEYVIDHKIGLSPSEKNYQRIVKNKRNVATLLLVDMSKSTKGETIHCEKQALVIMSEALKEVGDGFAIYGFSGDNRDNVDFYQIKGFDESHGPEVMKRISAIKHRFENRDGAALRHAANIIKTREEKTKLIILLSDGKPVDKAYTGNYAIEDTRMALLEAGKSGIHTFCVTVDKDAAEYLPRMYSHSNWTVINDVNKLPEKMYGIYGRLTH